MNKSTNGSSPASSEVLGKPVRRQFSAEYKLKILDEAERCNGEGEVGALLRREGLYSSHLSNWRKHRREGALASMAQKRRGRKARQSAAECESDALRRENERLRAKLERAEKIIEVQKQLSEVLGIPLGDEHDGTPR